MLLARTVCHCTLGELLERVSYVEFCLWLDEYQRRPWGDDIADLRMATICSTVANFSGNVRHAIAPAEFMPKFGPIREQTDEEIERICDATFG